MLPLDDVDSLVNNIASTEEPTARAVRGIGVAVGRRSGANSRGSEKGHGESDNGRETHVL